MWLPVKLSETLVMSTTNGVARATPFVRLPVCAILSHRARAGRDKGWVEDMRRVLLAAAVVGVAVGVLYTATATPTVTDRFLGSDGGELTATALSGGVAHPSGYPTYLLLARVALLLPFREPAGRLALLSALSGAVAAGCTTALVAVALSPRANEARRTAHLAAGVFAGMMLAVSPRMWSQSVIIEVYALHMAWLTVCALVLYLWLRDGRGNKFGGSGGKDRLDPGATDRSCRPLLPIAALCLGLGLGTHLTLAAFLPAAVLAWLATPVRPRPSWRMVVATGVALVAGLSVYGLLPLWAGREVVPSWGEPRTLAGLWAHVSGAEYRYLVGAVTPMERLNRVSFAARDLLIQPGLLALGLALWAGLPYGWQHVRPLVVLTASTALITLLFATGYATSDGQMYLLAWTWAWCVWAGLGVYALIETVERHPRRRMLHPILLAVLALASLWMLLARFGTMDVHDNTVARDRAIERLSGLAPDALLLTVDDGTTFDSWYIQQALNVRRDVLVVDIRLLAQPWYRRQLLRMLQVNSGEHVCIALAASGRPLYRVASDGTLNEESATVWGRIPACGANPPAP